MLFAAIGSKEANLPSIQIPRLVGKILFTIASIHRPKRILEIGTLGGYSTLWLAKALPEEGHLYTIDCSEEHIEIAKRHIHQAGKEEQITLLKGDAFQVLESLIDQKVDPFDLVFLDADKENYPRYLEPIISLSRVGTVILSDNLIPKRGRIGRAEEGHTEGEGIYKYNEQLASHPRLISHLFPTIVGEGGRVDALGVSIVK